jgi:hypothetical protein
MKNFSSPISQKLNARSKAIAMNKALAIIAGSSRVRASGGF